MDTFNRKYNMRQADKFVIVTLDNLILEAQNGFIPEPLFDQSGTISFVLDGGNYLPGLHELARGKKSGDHVDNVLIDAGWGEHRQDLLFIVPKQKLERIIPQFSSNTVKIGDVLKLRADMEVTVTEVNKDTVTIDANPPLAGSSYLCSFVVRSVEHIIIQDFSKDTDHQQQRKYEVATFALGCFWGAELCFMRIPGVVGTRVGYSQGITSNPTYEEVCSGRTRHREAVQVIYDSTIVTYEKLVEIAFERLQSVQSPLELHRLFEENNESENDDDDAIQYRHGIYYHTQEQQKIASRLVTATNNRFGIELLQASTFWKAEESHQQYLYKGGQSARKGAKEPIRCYG